MKFRYRAICSSQWDCNVERVLRLVKTATIGAPYRSPVQGVRVLVVKAR